MRISQMVVLTVVVVAGAAPASADQHRPEVPRQERIQNLRIKLDTLRADRAQFRAAGDRAGLRQVKQHIEGVRHQLHHLNGGGQGNRMKSYGVAPVPLSGRARAEIRALKNQRDTLFGQRAAARASGDTAGVKGLTKQIHGVKSHIQALRIGLPPSYSQAAPRPGGNPGASITRPRRQP